MSSNTNIIGWHLPGPRTVPWFRKSELSGRLEVTATWKEFSLGYSHPQTGASPTSSVCECWGRQRFAAGSSAQPILQGLATGHFLLGT